MNLKEEIFTRYGFVKRARGCFIYTEKKRLTDLYQEGGSAILGWGGTGGSITPFTLLKNFLSRGLTGSFRTHLEGQTDSAVSELFNSSRRAFIFSGKDDAESFCRENGLEHVFYSPWENEEKISNVSSIVMRVPLPWSEKLYCVAVPEEKSGLKTESECALVPAVRAALNRSLFDLIKALQVRQEKDWFIFDTVLNRYFERRGPYLIPKVPSEKHEQFVLHCLDCGIIINPDCTGKSIVPFGADRGVFAELKKNPFEF